MMQNGTYLTILPLCKAANSERVRNGNHGLELTNSLLPVHACEVQKFDFSGKSATEPIMIPRDVDL